MGGKNEHFTALALAAGRAYMRGIQTGSGGNLSCRGPGDNTMTVKASGGSFAEVSAAGESLVVTDLYGKPLPGESGKPTREFVLHGLLYRLLPELGGIMHCHSPWSIAWAFDHDFLPALTLHVQLKFGCDIPVVNVLSPMVREEDAPLVEAAVKNNPRPPAFILRAHGVVALGKNVVEAEHNAELVEETAQIALLRDFSERLSNRR
ncbi:MAG: class II aldolase/adducin family protein [Treponema sp.]|jgi:L-ribulose-5-phosphate 4-epimerase|nr:class II aldolase/adducin family protein [Treponema sp.]